MKNKTEVGYNTVWSRARRIPLVLAVGIALLILSTVTLIPRISILQAQTDPSGNPPPTVNWSHLSTKNGDLPLPSNSTDQTAALVLDIDQDGDQDFVIGSRPPGPSVVWY